MSDLLRCTCCNGLCEGHAAIARGDEQEPVHGYVHGCWGCCGTGCRACGNTGSFTPEHALSIALRNEQRATDKMVQAKAEATGWGDRARALREMVAAQVKP